MQWIKVSINMLIISERRLIYTFVLTTPLDLRKPFSSQQERIPQALFPLFPRKRGTFILSADK